MSEAAPDLTRRARERRLSGDLAGALEDLRVVLEANPASSEAWAERGLTRLAALLPGWSLLLSAGSLEGIIDAYNARIDVLSASRETAIRDAQADFSKALELSPDRAEAWLGRARLLTILGDPEARACYGRAADLLPSDASVRIERSGHLLNAKKAKEALEDAAAAVTQAPQSADAWAAQGRAKLARQDAKGARKDFDRALELDPGHFPSLLGRARSRAWDEPSAAREEHGRVAAATPVRAADYYYRGLAAEAKGDGKQAREDYRRSLEAIPLWSPEREDAEKRAGPPAGRTPLRRILESPVTSCLLGLCIAWMTVAEQSGSTTEVATLVRFGATDRGRVWSGETWRLVSSMFLHVGWIHLGWNMLVMFGLCGAVERLLGRGRFLAAYLGTGVAASALSLIGQNIVSAGASGAAFGMVGILLSGAYVKLGGLTPFLRHKGVFATLKWIAIWFVLGMTFMPFDNWGHLGGLLCGLAVGALCIAGPGLSAAARKAGWTALGVAFSLLLAASVYPWPWVFPDMKGWPDFESGVTLLQKGDYAAAESRFDRAQQQGFRSELLFFNRGLARQSQSRFKPAAEDFGVAILMNPQWAAPYHFRAYCRESLEQPREALQDYTSAVSHDAKNFEARSGRARVQITLGDPSAAARDYREALRLAPSDWAQRPAIEKWLKENGR